MATTKVTTDVIDMSGNAGGLTWVTGTTAQQPSGVIGEIREDTDTNRTLVYTDETGTAEWRNFKETAITLPTFNVHFLVIAGGASGGAWHGGGGGAGGYRTSYGTVSPITLNGGTMENVLALSLSTNYTITVGLGGGGVGTGGTGANLQGNAGSNSVFSGSDITDVTSTGGGFGTSIISPTPVAPGSGGSGGGGNNTAGGAAVTTPVIQGHAGGTGSGSAGNSYSSGGGGGAKLVGGNFFTTTSGSGGDGLENQITGATGIFYAGGGGGGVYIGGTPGTGGSSVGGNGGPASAPASGFPGAINTGSGGGGANSELSASTTTGSGGSGIVILRCTKATATLGSGITVNSTAGPGSVNGVLITGTSDYYYSATLGSGTITFS